MISVAALIFAVAYAAERAWHVYVDHANHAVSEPGGPRCRDCLRCAVCRRPMAEDGTPKPLRGLP